jgi:23S rRNA (guanosine2251-2'-O)-methyltransferase
MTVVLDNIRSAWNVGAIMRSCDAVGADLILLGYTPKPVGQTLNLIKKTAIGAENTVKWEHFEHYNELLATYPNKIHFAVELSEMSQNMFEYLKKPEIRENVPLSEVFLWFGNEIHGLEPALITRLGKSLFLPMEGTKESLNVASCVCTCTYLFRYALV